MKKTLNKVPVFLFSVFLFATFINPIFAEKYEDLEPTNYVNDFADALSLEEENILNQKLSDLERAKNYQITVAVVKSMDGDYIEHYAVKLFEKWGIGGKEKDEGALFLVSIEDRQMRIEVGYGLEPVLTDGVTKNILDNLVRPEFKNEDYFAGINVGVDSMINVLGGQVLRDSTSDTESLVDSSNWMEIFFFIFIFGINILIWLFAIMARTKSWWLGGIASFVIGMPLLYFFGFSLINNILLFVFIMVGFLFDYFISKNYKYWQSKMSINGQGSTGGSPAWWAGGSWGPGSGGFKNSSGGFGGFGGGSSGGGGSSSSW